MGKRGGGGWGKGEASVAVIREKRVGRGRRGSRREEEYHWRQIEGSLCPSALYTIHTIY